MTWEHFRVYYRGNALPGLADTSASCNKTTGDAPQSIVVDHTGHRPMLRIPGEAEVWSRHFAADHTGVCHTAAERFCPAASVRPVLGDEGYADRFRRADAARLDSGQHGLLPSEKAEATADARWNAPGRR